jgi:hypothetical protein
VRSNTPRGIDAVDTTLANREMILNDDQQSNLFNMIKAGQIIANSGGGPYALNVYLSVAQTADMIIECVNNGQTRQIEGRMVRQ